MSYSRVIAADHNRLVQSCGSLLGIATGLLADKQLNDSEIQFLQRWLETNEVIATQWPGDVLHSRVKEVVADSIITEAERVHLVQTLNELCGGSVNPSQTTGANQMAFDRGARVQFSGLNFCVTGEFVFGPRERVCEEIQDRGGMVLRAITKKLHYLVVGLRGSDEWKHGSYGTKIVKAIEYKRAGVPILIVSEDDWSAALKAS